MNAEAEALYADLKARTGGNGKSTDPTVFVEPSKVDTHLTDLGNARRLIGRHAKDLRFCPTLGKAGTWLVWDSKRWRPDTTGAIKRRAKDTVQAIFREAAALTDSKDRDKLWKHANESESAARLRYMVEVASTEREVVVEASELDANPQLLNVNNGTLDLVTGGFHAHRRGDLITKLAPVDYDPRANSSHWVKFLERVVPSPDLRAFLARAVGYSLSGDALEEVLFFLYGETNSGKSTTIESLKGVLGDYAATADFATLLKSRPRDGAAASADIARLAGVRFVGSVEVGDGAELATGIVKWLTGQDTITARHLYGSLFEFLPQFTLWLAANERPQAKDDDEALWRRIHTVPFNETIPEAERKKEVKQTLRRDPQVRSAILNWALDGLRDYLAVGLRPPPIVREATQAYRDAMDPLADFLEECCELGDPKADSELFSDLWEVYSGWAKKHRLVKDRLSQHHFKKRLDKAQIISDEKRPARRWGITLLQGALTEYGNRPL